ncbi:hypothetical protein [Vibrio phage vB_VhaP_PG11]|nr:hypothetical protein [Vibrio phage vB_VhaP_PG11]
MSRLDTLREWFHNKTQGNILLPLYVWGHYCFNGTQAPLILPHLHTFTPENYKEALRCLD